MTLTLKPVGHGNWKTLTMTVDGDRASPLLVKLEDTITIGGVVFRITEIKA